MKPALPVLLALAVGAAALAQQPAATPGAAPSARKTDPFERTRKQIEDLVGRRDAADKYEPARYNPFLIGALPDANARTEPGDDTPVPVRPITSDETVLQQLAAQLKVSGSVRRDNRTLLVINGTPRGEGDTITLPHEGGNAVLQVKSITLGWFVVTYGKAELQLRY